MTRLQLLLLEIAASLAIAYLTGRGLNNKANRMALALERIAAAAEKH